MEPLDKVRRLLYNNEGERQTNRERKDMQFSLNNHNGNAQLASLANTAVHNYPKMVRANWGYQA